MKERVAQVPSIVVIVLALAIAPAALAARGGGGGGGKPGGGTAPTATLSADCNPCSPGYVHFTGSDYNASYPSAQVGVNGGCCFGVPVYANGTVDFSWNLSVPGSYTVQVYQWDKNGRNLILKGQTTVLVQ